METARAVPYTAEQAFMQRALSRLFLGPEQASGSSHHRSMAQLLGMHPGLHGLHRSPPKRQEGMQQLAMDPAALAALVTPTPNVQACIGAVPCTPCKSEKLPNLASETWHPFGLRPVIGAVC